MCSSHIQGGLVSIPWCRRRVEKRYISEMLRDQNNFNTKKNQPYKTPHVSNVMLEINGELPFHKHELDQQYFLFSTILVPYPFFYILYLLLRTSPSLIFSDHPSFVFHICWLDY